MALKLIYRAQTNIPVEIEGLVPRAVRGKSPSQIERPKLLPTFRAGGRERLLMVKLQGFS